MNRQAVEPTRWDSERVEDDAPALDIARYVAIVAKYKWAILALALIVGAFAWVSAKSITPVFRATATLLIESSQAQVVSIEEVYGLPGANREYFATQFEILRSRDLAERVIDELDLTRLPEFNPALREPSGVSSWLPFGPDTPAEPPTEQQIRRAALGAFTGSLQITPVVGTQLVRINFESTDRELAARVANTMGQAYIERGLEARLEMTQSAASWLTERLDVLRENLGDSEQRLQAFREQEGLVDIGGVLTFSATEMDALTGQLVTARQRRSQAENALNLLGMTPESEWDSLGPVIADPLVQSLRSSESEASRRVAELSSRYGPKHPTMVAAMSDLRKAEAALREQIQKVVAGYRDQFEQAEASVRDIQRQLEASRADVQVIQRKEYRLQELEREVETNQRLYDMFLTRFKETSQSGFQDANARFVDPAEPPMGAVRPRTTRIVGIALFLSLLAGVGLAFLREALDNTVKNPDDLGALGVAALGSIPLVKSMRKDGGDSVTDVFTSSAQGGFAESLRTVRTGVLLSSLDDPHRVIVVTSSVPGEGKTTVATGLALSLGQMERVLLIDADMRRPTLARQFGIEAGAGGLSALMAGNVKFADCVHSAHGIDVLTAGAVPPNPLELLSSQRFRKLLETLRERYDRIVIDSAPCQAVSDALVLSTMVDALIFVVRSDSTARQLAQTAIRRLREVDAPIIGAVLNVVDFEKKARYGYGSDYKGYYQTYGGYTASEGKG